MAFQFSDPLPHIYRHGMLYLGRSDDGDEIGVKTERHAITIAGAGSGKGAALIIPNLLRWPHSAVVIDPKGENAEKTWRARHDMGQLVGVVDPFHCADVPPASRVSINPLALVDPTSLAARADIQAIADGLVIRHNPQHAQWDSGAAAILAGVMAYVIGTAPPSHRTLTAVRKILLQPDGIPEKEGDEPSGLYADALRMTAFDGCGGLAPAVGRTIITALTSTKGMERDCLGGAKDHTAWIDDPAHAAVLGSSTFDLNALKTGKASLYLVIPPQYLDTQGAFLRLFVRTALNVMMTDGNRKNRPCLFILDEFHSLGKMQIVATAAGLMRSYGVQLWPFLQDLGQLQHLYTPTGAETFFGNADAHIFFGNGDSLTLEYVSRRIGNFTPEELAGPFEPLEPVLPRRHVSAAEKANGVEPDPTVKNIWAELPETGNWWTGKQKNFVSENEQQLNSRIAHEDRNAATKRAHEDALRKSAYEYMMRKVGTPRMFPRDIAAMTGKGDHDLVATSMIVLGKKGQVFKLKLCPYFIEEAKRNKASMGQTA